jgi:Tfp pilus assembly protein FimT
MLIPRYSSSAGTRLQCRAKSPEAFTLMELILVLAIVVTAISMAAPAMGSFFRGRAQDSEAREILSLTRYAQSRAVTEGYPVEIWFNIRERTYGMQIVPGYVDNDPRAVDFDVSDYLSLEIVGQAKSRNQTSMIFLPNGEVDSSSLVSIAVVEQNSAPITVTLADNGLSYEIRNQNQSVQNAFR